MWDPKKSRNLCTSPKMENPVVLMSNPAMRRKFVSYHAVLVLEPEVKIWIVSQTLTSWKTAIHSSWGRQEVAVPIRQCLLALTVEFLFHFPALGRAELLLSCGQWWEDLPDHGWAEQKWESSASAPGFGTALGLPCRKMDNFTFSRWTNTAANLLFSSLWGFAGVCGHITVAPQEGFVSEEISSSGGWDEDRNLCFCWKVMVPIVVIETFKTILSGD